MLTEKIRINHHERNINGTFYRPEQERKFPIVIFSHGFNGHETDFAVTAQYYAENGIGSVCYNFCGGSLRDTSGFATTQMSLLTEKEDLLAVIAEVRTWDCCEEENVYLFGASQGGMVSALVAEEKESEIRGLILLYPALCIPEDWRAHFPKEEDIPETYELWGVPLGRAYFEAARELDIKKELGGYKKPVLIMHGVKDGVVPIRYSEWAATKYPNARLELFEKEGHGFTPNGDRRMEAMAFFFLHSCENKTW